MGVLQKALSGYNPSGAFAFEIRKKNPVTGQFANVALAKTFFMLAPESMTITEGYKIKVNKTISGAWVDDFGNDVKKISISGSLYSFFFGTARTNLDAYLNTEIASFVTGNYAINEFFKLRFIVSRFRDSWAGIETSREMFDVSKNFPSLIPFTKEINKIRINKGNPYEEFSFIFRDYDDGNHFEVIFDKFDMRRDKSDPFTVNYNIEMTAINRINTRLRFANRFLRGGIKETAIQFSNANLQALNTLIEETNSIVSIPVEIVNSVLVFKNAVESVASSLNTFVIGVVADWKKIQSQFEEKKLEIDVTISNMETSSTGENQENFDDEDVDLPDETIESYNQALKSKILTTQGSGLGLYSTGTEKKDLFLKNTQELSEEDFDVNNELENKDNSTEQRNFLFYTIQDNDTLFKICLQFYNNLDYVKIISEINSIKNSDFEDNLLSGRTIKIPNIANASNVDGTENLTYYNLIGNENIETIKNKVLGGDIKLSNERDFIANSKGDLDIIYGEECYKQNILDFLSFPLGIIKELDDEFGTPLTIGEVPTELFQKEIEETILDSVYLDPRTDFAYVNEDDFQYQGDAVPIPIIAKTITGEELSLDALLNFK